MKLLCSRAKTMVFSWCNLWRLIYVTQLAPPLWNPSAECKATISVKLFKCFSEHFEEIYNMLQQRNLPVLQEAGGPTDMLEPTPNLRLEQLQADNWSNREISLAVPMLCTNAMKVIHQKNYKNMSCVTDIEVDKAPTPL